MRLVYLILLLISVTLYIYLLLRFITNFNFSELNFLPYYAFIYFVVMFLDIIFLHPNSNPSKLKTYLLAFFAIQFLVMLAIGVFFQGFGEPSLINGEPVKIFNYGGKVQPISWQEYINLRTYTQLILTSGSVLSASIPFIRRLK